MEEIKSSSVSPSDNKSINVAKIWSVGTLAIQVIIAVLYGCGVASFYGKQTDIMTMVNNAFGIFNMGRAYYRGIFGCALAVLYFVLWGLIVSDFINSIRVFKIIFSKSHSASETIDRVTVIERYAILTFTRVLIFMVSVGFVKSYTINFNAKAVFVLGICMLLITRLKNLILKKYTLKSMLINAGQCCTAILCIILILANAQTSAVEQVINSFHFLFHGGSFISFLLIATSAVASLLIIIFALTAIIDVSSLMSIGYVDVKAMLFSTGVYLAVPLAHYVIGGNTITVSSLIDIISTYLPLALSVVALFLLTFSPIDAEIRKSTNEDEQSTEKTTQETATS
ncbi:MAG: hypothetical protein ACI3X1_01250 [Eubacteriales bacterium]